VLVQVELDALDPADLQALYHLRSAAEVVV
jgi:hypothetical protein